MITTRQNFSERQPRMSICASGRTMVAINERKIQVARQEPTGMGDDGEMLYEERMVTEFAYDVCWLEGVANEDDLLGAAKKAVTDAITAYDTSPSVNGFMLNGQRVWLNKDTRVGLMNSTSIAKGMGKTTTTLWFGGMEIEVNCDKAIGLLSALEMYALECFNVTAAHKKAVAELNTVEEVLGYDYTKGYPEQLRMEVSL